MEKDFLIRQMREEDLDKVTDIHMITRPKETTMITRLGRNFCYELIKVIHKTEPKACFVAEQDRKIIGYFLGSSDFKKLNRKIIISLGPSLIPRLITKRYKIYGGLYKIIYLIYYSFKYSSKIDKTIKAEEIEIAVLSEGRKKGIASSFVKNFFSYLRLKNIKNVHVSAYKNEINSIKFHSRFYTPICTVKTNMDEMVHFIVNIENGEDYFEKRNS